MVNKLLMRPYFFQGIGMGGEGNPEIILPESLTANAPEHSTPEPGRNKLSEFINYHLFLKNMLCFQGTGTLQ